MYIHTTDTYICTYITFGVLLPLKRFSAEFALQFREVFATNGETYSFRPSPERFLL